MKRKKRQISVAKVIDKIGGTSEAAKATGIFATTLSSIKTGFKEPTATQAIKLSIATNGEITAEQIKPDYDFSYIYEYVRLVGK